MFGGVPGRVVDAVRGGVADGVVSLHILSEFIDVLTRPRFGFDDSLALALAEEIASFTQVVPLSTASQSWVADPDDDPVVEAALLGRATLIVSGDRHIRTATINGVRVVTPAEAARMLEEPLNE